MINHSLLKIIHFRDLAQWDVKYFLSTTFTSKYPMSTIGENTIHITKKDKLFNEPEKEFKILGISNDIGMFDAYTELGKNINQPYIHVENGCLAYNPYRINVGSIGLKTKKQENEYISPAYVVFKCRETLLPEYLFLVLKTNILNTLINESTTGAVRQTLSYDKLATIKIPLPSLEEQNNLVEEYHKKIIELRQKEKQIPQLEDEIEEYLLNTLDIVPLNNKQNSNSLLNTVSFCNLINWSVEFNLNSMKPQNIFQSKSYKNLPIEHYCSINPTTQIPDTAESISFVPMGNVSDKFGEITKLENISTNKIKGYTKFQENDVLWARITPCMQNGKCAVAKDLKNSFGCGSTEFHVLRSNKNILPEFLYCLLRTKRIREIAPSYFTGASGQQRINADFMKSLTIPEIPVSCVHGGVSQELIVKTIFETKNAIKRLFKEIDFLKESARQQFEEDVFK